MAILNTYIVKTRYRNDGVTACTESITANYYEIDEYSVSFYLDSSHDKRLGIPNPVFTIHKDALETITLEGGGI